MSKYGVDFRQNNGKGVVRADGFEIGDIGSPKPVVNSTVTFNPPSLATGAFAEADVTVAGVAVGDRIDLFPPYDLQAIQVQGAVASANTVTISLSSCNAGTVDLASGSWGVVAWRR